MNDRLQRIQALADSWGSLYLFHPAIGRDLSQRDWGQTFITALPQVEQATDLATALDIIKTHVVDHLPSVQTVCMDSPDSRVHAGWNEDGYPYVYGQKQVQDAGQSSLLFRLEQQPRALGQSETKGLSRAERMLGLCKVWIVLRYFAPQIARSKLDLNTLLSNWLPRVEAAAGVEEYYHVLAALAVQLADRHAGVIAPPEWSSNAIEYRPLKQTLLGSTWLGKKQYLRALTDNLVYMWPFAMPAAPSLRETFTLIQNTHGLMLDLRGYPQTHFQHELVRCLCELPVSSPRYEIPVVGEPDVRKRSWKVIQYIIQPDGRAVYTQPVVALIDETTQSSAEDFCMYLKIAERVTFVGRCTAGCVGNATYVNLPGGGRFTFTGMRVTWPDGSPVWGIGIVPDVIVESKRVIPDRDETLEKGLETLRALCVYEPVSH